MASAGRMALAVLEAPMLRAATPRVCHARRRQRRCSRTAQGFRRGHKIGVRIASGLGQPEREMTVRAVALTRLVSPSRKFRDCSQRIRTADRFFLKVAINFCRLLKTWSRGIREGVYSLARKPGVKLRDRMFAGDRSTSPRNARPDVALRNRSARPFRIAGATHAELKPPSSTCAVSEAVRPGDGWLQGLPHHDA